MIGIAKSARGSTAGEIVALSSIRSAPSRDMASFHWIGVGCGKLPLTAKDFGARVIEAHHVVPARRKVPGWINNS
jgi:hypothetical protein